MLVLAAMNPDAVTVTNLPDSTDVLDMLKSLTMIGLNIEIHDDSSVTIHNSFPACESISSEAVLVECGYGGTTTRFLSSLLILGHKRYYLEASGHMRQRPMSEIVAPFEQLGVEVKLGSDEAWIVLQGPAKNKVKQLEVDASRSTQFASALVMTLSTWGGEVKPLGMNASEKYFNMTLDCIFQASQNNWSIPLDFSSLTYPVALAALQGHLTVENFGKIDHFQPDSVFLKIVDTMNGKVSFSKKELKIEKNESLSSWSGDCSGFPDLVPTLAFLCAHADGESHLSGLEVLQHKESDRVQEILNILKLYDIECSYQNSKLIIVGKSFGHKNKVYYKAPDDHRMIMMAALFMRANGGGEIENWKHVKKSYSFFFEDVIDK